MMIIHAFITVNSEHREKFLELAHSVIQHSQAEEGNISYHLYEDTAKPNAFVMLEVWKDLAAIEFHGTTEHYKTFIKETKDILLEPPRVERYEVSGNL